jgi:hypothetical protein
MEWSSIQIFLKDFLMWKISNFQQRIPISIVRVIVHDKLFNNLDINIYKRVYWIINIHNSFQTYIFQMRFKNISILR